VIVVVVVVVEMTQIDHHQHQELVENSRGQSAVGHKEVEEHPAESGNTSYNSRQKRRSIIIRRCSEWISNWRSNIRWWSCEELVVVS
jgi:hypothetical protein